MSFSDLKNRIRAMGRPKSSEGYRNLLNAFTAKEKQILLTTQLMIAHGHLSGELEESVEQAMRMVVAELDYLPQQAADFLRLGEDLFNHMPDCPNVEAKIAAYIDDLGNPFISKTRH
jgi:hypothetical protein